MLLRRVGQERDRAGALERRGQRPLVAGAGPGDAPREDLAPGADEAAKARDLLVVDVVDLLDAERAYLSVRALRSPRTPSFTRTRCAPGWGTASVPGG